MLGSHKTNPKVNSVEPTFNPERSFPKCQFLEEDLLEDWWPVLLNDGFNNLFDHLADASVIVGPHLSEEAIKPLQ